MYYRITFPPLSSIEGRRAEEACGMMINPDEEEKSPSLRFAERLFNIMDENEDGVLTMEEFVKGFHKLKVKGNCYGNTVVTAYVTERTLTKEDWEPKPAITLRKKSLRRGSDLKLFNLINQAKEAGNTEDNQGGDIDASSAAAAAKAAIKIAAKVKMRRKSDGTDEYYCEGADGIETIIDAASAAAAAKAATKLAAKVKMRKKDDGTEEYYTESADGTETIIDAASAAAAARAANKIAAKVKMRRKDDGTLEAYLDDEDPDPETESTDGAAVDIAASVSGVAKIASRAAEARARVRKQGALRKIRKVWKIKQIW